MHDRHWARVTLAMTMLMTGLAADAGPADGDARRVTLLELYTSEGCNSCPPADRWVSALPPRLVPEKLVVLAFHVDYWNYLGWEDRFSQRRFSERQQALVRANDLRTAYTPQLVLNGRDYRRLESIESAVARINAKPADARVVLRAEQRATSIRVAVSAELTASMTEAAALYVALYENNLETEVRAGENRGRRLRHDYVVRALTGPFPIEGGKTTRREDDFPVSDDWKTQDLGVAAFVQSDRTGEVLQAAAAPLARAAGDSLGRPRRAAYLGPGNPGTIHSPLAAGVPSAASGIR
jgi:hypothetical protein